MKSEQGNGTGLWRRGMLVGLVVLLGVSVLVVCFLVKPQHTEAHPVEAAQVAGNPITEKTVPAFASSGLGQDTATTRDGRNVILNTDGTWHYVTPPSASIAGSAIETVRAYCAAASWRDRIPLVLNSEKVKPLMEAHYGSAWKPLKFEILTRTEPTPSPTGWVKVEAAFADNSTAVYYLTKTRDGYRIDWESSIGYNPVSPTEFRATRPTNPVRLRVWAKLDDYYNYEFSHSRDVAWSILLGDDREYIGYGYAKKDTAMGRDLFKTLKDGKARRVVVEVQCLPGTMTGEGFRSCLFMITEVLSHEGWRLEETNGVVK